MARLSATTAIVVMALAPRIMVIPSLLLSLRVQMLSKLKKVERAGKLLISYS